MVFLRAGTESCYWAKGLIFEQHLSFPNYILVKASLDTTPLRWLKADSSNFEDVDFDVSLMLQSWYQKTAQSG